jgi:hypothetical protein
MGTAEDTGAIEERLDKLLRSVNDWLKFAETKNAGIVGLSSGGAAVGLAFVNTSEVSRSWLIVGLYALAGLSLLLSLSLALGSFLPQMTLTKLLAGDDYGVPQPDDNLYFYGHLAKYPPRDLVEAIARRYEERAPPVTIAERVIDLAEQVVINSRITVWKLRLFQRAVALFALAIVALALAVIVGSV